MNCTTLNVTLKGQKVWLVTRELVLVWSKFAGSPKMDSWKMEKHCLFFFFFNLQLSSFGEFVVWSSAFVAYPPQSYVFWDPFQLNMVVKSDYFSHCSLPGSSLNQFGHPLLSSLSSMRCFHPKNCCSQGVVSENPRSSTVYQTPTHIHVYRQQI